MDSGRRLLFIVAGTHLDLANGEERYPMRLFRKYYRAIALAALISVAIGLAGADPRSGRITVPVMTPFTVKLDDAVNIKTAEKGAGFTATLTRPVQIDGITVIPAGASAAGLVNKDPQYSIELNSIFVNGRLYRVTTSPIAINRKASVPPGSTFTFNLELSVSIAK
jgi:hypothetical protein